ncbi:diguanylate cyclase [Insulibacter thermoxylanivorax]|uniref:Diguanylate cyclase n=1 Tax=Insulibacter thermoxylanivorax TaxID=2749268 RepID=A0A916QDY7_9BACL|nr:dipeptidase [Insulibacter thermoxylanivorax]GFR37648.1 diguanylate cyclase [Insulibacter thermoxylanivorax]
MRIYDLHCDVLYKMLLEPRLSFSDDKTLDVTYERLVEGGIGLQAFAIFLPEDRVPTFEMVEEAVHAFHTSILSRPKMVFVKSREDLSRAEREGGIGALLTLEGAEGLMGSLEYLQRAYDLGVRCLGLTWNYANWAADGVLEERRAGLTLKGRELVARCDEIGMIIDISHLNEPGFWEVLEFGKRPVIASHSNAAAVTGHPRNLSDEQIQAVIVRGGCIGITFVPDFIGGGQGIADVLKHLDHVCSLGGEDHVGFGSDFDGIDEYLHGLTHPGQYVKLTEALHKHYSSEQVEKFLHQNWRRFLEANLPE